MRQKQTRKHKNYFQLERKSVFVSFGMATADAVQLFNRNGDDKDDDDELDIDSGDGVESIDCRSYEN